MRSQVRSHAGTPVAVPVDVLLLTEVCSYSFIAFLHTTVTRPPGCRDALPPSLAPCRTSDERGDESGLLAAGAPLALGV